MAQKPIQLYTACTPNGHKVNIAFEELGIPYEVHKIDLGKNVQKEPWFLEINPNGRIPAVVDPNANNGQGQRIFEGGAILQYLTGRYDKQHKFSFPYDSPEYWETIEWTTWMQSGLGPMQGQTNHFYRYAPEKIQYVIDRYQTETKRLYQVLEDRLSAQAAKATEGGSIWIVGGKYTFADLACFSWIEWHQWAGLSLDKFPRIREWKETIEARPATEKGLNVPDKFELREAMKTKEGEEEYAKYHSNWVLRGHKAEREQFK